MNKAIEKMDSMNETMFTGIDANYNNSTPISSYASESINHSSEPKTRATTNFLFLFVCIFCLLPFYIKQMFVLFHNTVYHPARYKSVTKTLQNKKTTENFSIVFFELFFKLQKGAGFFRPTVLRHIFAVKFGLPPL